MKTLLSLLWLMMVLPSMACTSAIIPASKSATGRPIIWKHRDTGADNNFLYRVEPAESGSIGYVGLFNGGDSLLTEAWMGFNDAGFAIINTASYNLAPDTAVYKDQEGRVMALALSKCRSLADFENLLAELPKPMGVQANFGVVDALGAAAYYETDDFSFTKYDVGDSIVIRTNFSFSGEKDKGAGYIRYLAAEKLLGEVNEISPEYLVDTVSSSFYHGLIGRDMAEDAYVNDRDFIPRKISTASIAIECVNPGQEPSEIRAYGKLGYPPLARANKITLTYIPAGFTPAGELWRSQECDRAFDLRRKCISFPRGNGFDYLDMQAIKYFSPSAHTLEQ